MSSNSDLVAAREALTEGHAMNAVHLAKRYLLDNDEDVAGLRVLFEALQRAGRVDDACVIGQRIIDVAPTDFETRLATARLELEHGRPSKTIELLSEHVGQDRAATAMLAEAYERSGQTMLAASLRDAIPNASWVGDGVAEDEFKRLYFSRQLCSLLERYDNDTPLSEELRAVLEEGRYPEAAELLRQWLPTTSESVRKLALADWWFLQGDLNRAQLSLEEASVDKELRGAWENRRGDLAQSRGEYSRARACYRKATVLDSDDTNAWLDLARTEFLCGNENDAIQACEQVLESDAHAVEEERWLAREMLSELQSDKPEGRVDPDLYGLVWWERGGGLLEVEINEREDRDGLVLTGNVGRNLEDAGRVAFEFTRSEYDCFEKQGVHIHFPEFRSPKDGGSAGVLLAALLYAACRKKELSERIAITGELTLSGEIRPVSGIREKVTSAHLHGVDRVILPSRNTGDLLSVPLAAKRSLQFTRVDEFRDVLSSLRW